MVAPPIGPTLCIVFRFIITRARTETEPKPKGHRNGGLGNLQETTPPRHPPYTHFAVHSLGGVSERGVVTRKFANSGPETANLRWV